MATIADFSPYPAATEAQLVAQLCIVCSELYNAHIVLGSTLAQEKSARAHAFRMSEETTVSGRDRDADMQALSLTLGAIEIRAQIQALVEERDLLRLLIGRVDATQRAAVDESERLLTGDQG